MRILLVNTSERTGGAAIAANRLMNALNHNGQEARMLVRDKTTQNDLVTALPNPSLNHFRFVMERAEIYVHNRFKKHRIFEVDHATHGMDITSLPEFKKADVIHLHWVNQGMLSLGDITRILAREFATMPAIVTGGKAVVGAARFYLKAHHAIFPTAPICVSSTHFQKAPYNLWLAATG